MKNWLYLFFLLVSTSSYSQEKNPHRLVQISGVIVTGDSLNPVPYSTIMIKNTYRGVVSDYFGFFSIVAQETDTLEFAALGFKRSFFVIPDTLTEQRYSLIQILRSDTIVLREALIYPWPTKEQFKEAFINLHLPDDDLNRAKRQLDRANMALVAQKMQMDGSMNYKELMNYHSNEFYNAGQVQTYNIFNPLAWAKFIEQWKSGAFKTQNNK